MFEKSTSDSGEGALVGDAPEHSGGGGSEMDDMMSMMYGCFSPACTLSQCWRVLTLYLCSLSGVPRAPQGGSSAPVHARCRVWF